MSRNRVRTKGRNGRPAVAMIPPVKGGIWACVDHLGGGLHAPGHDLAAGGREEEQADQLRRLISMNSLVVTDRSMGTMPRCSGQDQVRPCAASCSISSSAIARPSRVPPAPSLRIFVIVVLDRRSRPTALGAHRRRRAHHGDQRQHHPDQHPAQYPPWAGVGEMIDEPPQTQATQHAAQDRLLARSPRRRRRPSCGDRPGRPSPWPRTDQPVRRAFGALAATSSALTWASRSCHPQAAQTGPGGVGAETAELAGPVRLRRLVVSF